MPVLDDHAATVEYVVPEGQPVKLADLCIFKVTAVNKTALKV